MGWNKWEDAADKGPYSIGLKVFIFIVVFSILSGCVGLAWHFILKPIQVVDRVTDPDRMIYTYEWFHSHYEEVKAAQSQADIKQGHIDQFKKDAGPRKDWKFGDRQEYNRLVTELNGVKAHRVSLIREYNARAKMVTRSIFKGGSLPDSIAE